MPKKLIRVILTFILLSTIELAATDTVVPPVRTMSMQRVSGQKVSNQFIDFTSCSFDDSEFDVTITNCDTLVSVVFPDRRYVFTTQGDTVFMLCEENRDIKISFPAGISILFKDPAPYQNDSIELSGRYRQHQNLYGNLKLSVSAPTMPPLITVNGDTLYNVRCDHFWRLSQFAFCEDSVMKISDTPDSLIVTSITDTRLYTLFDEEFPRVIMKKTTVSGNQGSLSDSTTYLLRSDPMKSGSPRRMVNLPENNSYTPDGNESLILISQDGENVTILPSDIQRQRTLIINDIAGRVFHSGKISSQDLTVMDITFLPKGEYLIQLYDDGKLISIVKFIRS